MQFVWVIHSSECLLLLNLILTPATSFFFFFSFSARTAVIDIARLIMWTFKLWFGKHYTSEVFVQIPQMGLIGGLITRPVILFCFVFNGNLERSMCAWDRSELGLVCVCMHSYPSSFPYFSLRQDTDLVVSLVNCMVGYTYSLAGLYPPS